MSVFETLNKIDVNEHTEAKNGLTYLSWAWAWAELKKHYPEATYTVYEDSNGCIYHTDGRTAWVKTGVTVEGIEHIEYLPVMDFKNKSIPLENLTSFDVNKAIQRSLTKAVARHGLGLYIYAGEDLPEEMQEPADAVTIAAFSKLLEETQTDGVKMVEWMNTKFKVKNQAIKDFTKLQLVEGMKALEKKKEKAK